VQWEVRKHCWGVAVMWVGCYGV